MVMDVSVNYVVSNYLGKRRYAPALEADPLFYVKKHCQFFQDNIVPHLSKITFVLNKCSDNERDHKFIDYVGSVRLNVPHELVVRENSGFSYGAWQDVVIKNKEYPFHFLTEDDYIPVIADFLSEFLKHIDERIIYVCSLYSPINYRMSHCAISNGLLNSSVILKENIINKTMPLNAILTNSDDYRIGCDNQILFLQNFSRLNYKIKDMTGDFNIPFLEPSGKITNYGNSLKPYIIIPIQ
jgi:hypothetical protein